MVFLRTLALTLVFWQLLFYSLKWVARTPFFQDETGKFTQNPWKLLLLTLSAIAATLTFIFYVII